MKKSVESFDEKLARLSLRIRE